MGHGGSVIEELMADHREVAELFDGLQALPPGDDRRRQIVDEFTIELVRHSVAEEQYLYPAVREHVPGGATPADKEIADHAAVERLLKELEGMAAADGRFALAERVVAEVTEHIADEEDNLSRRSRTPARRRSWRNSASGCGRRRSRDRRVRTPPPRPPRRPTSRRHPASAWSTAPATWSPAAAGPEARAAAPPAGAVPARPWPRCPSPARCGPVRPSPSSSPAPPGWTTSASCTRRCAARCAGRPVAGPSWWTVRRWSSAPRRASTSSCTPGRARGTGVSGSCWPG
ncbi:hypothetical protein GCM10009639_52560 [Kitasatospora putterlickiae]|uniref:Hemerythrin-like domain-containing protein n=1 Tax=Kitasatospora putterlickiae TaxID=221725 RepID=A0ABN1YDB8_9ACTN